MGDTKALVVQFGQSYYPDVHDGLTIRDAQTQARYELLNQGANYDERRQCWAELELLGFTEYRGVRFWLTDDDGTGQEMGMRYMGEERG